MTDAVDALSDDDLRATARIVNGEIEIALERRLTK